MFRWAQHDSAVGSLVSCRRMTELSGSYAGLSPRPTGAHCFLGAQLPRVSPGAILGRPSGTRKRLCRCITAYSEVIRKTSAYRCKRRERRVHLAQCSQRGRGRPRYSRPGGRRYSTERLYVLVDSASIWDSCISPLRKAPPRAAEKTGREASVLNGRSLTGHLQHPRRLLPYILRQIGKCNVCSS